MKEIKNGISLEDRISVPTKRVMTDAGQMIVPGAIARTGVLIYKGSSLGLMDRADELIEVHRSEDEVFDEESVASFRNAPVTVGHPKDSNGKAVSITAKNAKDFQVGMLEGLPTRDEDTLAGNLVIARQDAIDAIEDGTNELSAGYKCDIFVDEDGKFWQKNIRGNHIAIVKKGRAGPICSLSDEYDLGDEDGKVEAEGNDNVEEKSEDSSSESSDSTLQDGLEDSQGIDQPVDEPQELSVEDMSEADAANLVAEEEEYEADSAVYESEWADMYAKDAALMAKAHLAVAKAARKIANKQAKSVNDSAGEGGDINLDGHNLTDDIDSILSALDVAEKEVVDLKATLEDTVTNMESEINSKCDIIILAKDMTDIKDFSDKTVSEIKSMVVSDVLGINLEDKSEAYIDARFDILCEDSNKETPMGRLLKNQILEDAKPKTYTSPVAIARKNMIERLTNKNKD